MQQPHVKFRDALLVWVKVGLMSFGGPTGQIALMHTELVEKRKWVSEESFLRALNYCMLLPGPEAQQLSVYVGWLLHRTLGGIMAGTLFVLPGAALMFAVSWIYAVFGNVPFIEAIFHGLKAAVVAIVAAAFIRIGKKALKNPVMWLLAALAFAAIRFLGAPFPLIIASAALIGIIGAKFWRKQFLVLNSAPTTTPTASPPHHSTTPTLRRTLTVAAVCLILWWLPVLSVGVFLGTDSVPFKQGLFFSKVAVVTFGGAYAVLPYVAQQAVEHHQWLSAGEMMDGLGLAETTPGPLILVLEFVGFLGGWHHAGGLSPIVAATLGALITTWVIFLPSFLFIFLGAPFIERWRGNEWLAGALSAITAAVVGVILNLAVWFGLHTLFPNPDAAQWFDAVDWFALTLAAVAFVGLWKWKWDVVPVVLVSGALGLAHHFVVAHFGGAQ